MPSTRAAFLPQPVLTLTKTPQLLRALLAGTTVEKMSWKPSPERWSISEVLNHLVDVEKSVFELRVKRLVEEAKPRLESIDPDAHSAEGLYSGGDPLAHLERFTQLRDRTIDYLHRLSEDDWQRPGIHPEVGEIRVENLIHQWAFHDLTHLRQITDLLRVVCYWDAMGPLQSFYRID